MIWRIACLLLCCAVCSSAWANEATEPAWRIDHWVIASGGVVALSSEEGDWQLSGTIGQWGASEPRALSADGWRLTGGFWGFAVGPLLDLLFQDRFQQVLQSALREDEGTH